MALWHYCCYKAKKHSMNQENSNRYCFLGKVTEVYQQDGQRWMRTICTPGKIMIQIPEENEFNLGDSVKVTCFLKVEKLEKQCNS